MVPAPKLVCSVPQSRLHLATILSQEQKLSWVIGYSDENERDV
jgi:hypothetical protein